jgi:peptide deformylase
VWSVHAEKRTSQASGNGASRIRLAQLRLRIHPDPILRRVCEPVEQFDGWVSGVLGKMLDLMRTHGGIGLAAPQVGIARRMLVAEIEGQVVRLINPVITASTGFGRLVEGCLSLPEREVDIERPWEIEVLGFDSRGRKQEFRVSGLWARVIQHEIDHLNGVLICDHALPDAAAGKC